jgi:uncharacterized damage-inducible protein DinB
MRARDVRQQFEYLIETRRRFLTKFRQIGWVEFTKARGATWDSMLAVLLHILDDEEGWWQIASQGGSLAETPDRKPDRYANLDQVEEDNARVSTLTLARLEKLTDEDLGRSVTFAAGETITR